MSLDFHVFFLILARPGLNHWRLFPRDVPVISGIMTHLRSAPLSYQNGIWSVRPSIFLLVCLSICLSIHLSVYSFVCLYICLSIHLSVYPSACLAIIWAWPMPSCHPPCMSIHPSICLFTPCLSAHQFICLSICLSISFASVFVPKQ